MYKKVLVPHAGSPADDKALEHVIKIAKGTIKELTILHVIEDIPMPPLLTLNFKEQKLVNDIKNARGELKISMHKMLDVKVKTFQEQGIAASVKVLHGNPDEEIIRIIDDESYDLVVMAKRKKLPGIKGILKLGSVSRKILEKVSCPVLFIDGEKK